jgi:predicted exporter
MTQTDPTNDFDGTNHRAFAVTVAALSSLASFGSLAVARYQALTTIGYAVLIGLGSAALYALLLCPILARQHQTPPK